MTDPTDTPTEEPRYEWSEWIALHQAHNERVNAEEANLFTPYGMATFTVGDLRGLAITMEAAAYYLAESSLAQEEGVRNVIAGLWEDHAFIEGLLAYCPKADFGKMPPLPGD